jgi:hypothetical protein
MLHVFHAGWQMSRDEIEICHQPDGSQWLLGEGRFGKVFLATKGGVQVQTVLSWQGKQLQY